MMSMHSQPREGVAPLDDEFVELVAMAERILGRSLEQFLADGVVPQQIISGGGSYGRPQEARSSAHDRQRVYVYRPCGEEVESHRVWHDYCEEHGYPFGEKAGEEGYPPWPSDGGGEWVALSWKRIRAWLRSGELAKAEPQQLELFGVAA